MTATDYHPIRAPVLYCTTGNRLWTRTPDTPSTGPRYMETSVRPVGEGGGLTAAERTGTRFRGDARNGRNDGRVNRFENCCYPPDVWFCRRKRRKPERLPNGGGRRVNASVIIVVRRAKIAPINIVRASLSSFRTEFRLFSTVRMR